ncbi:MAG: nuclear transport factor 2 family protein [Acidobacteriota bacterium]
MSESNIELVKRAYGAYAKGDFGTAFSLFDHEIEIIQTPDLPWGGKHIGFQGAKAFFSKIAEYIDAQPHPETYIPAGDDIAVVGRLQGKTRKTNRPIDIAIVHIWTIREGKFTRFQAFIDTPAMLAALHA